MLTEPTKKKLIIITVSIGNESEISGNKFNELGNFTPIYQQKRLPYFTLKW